MHCGHERVAEDGKFDFEEFCHLYSKKREADDKRKEDLLICVNRLFPAKGSSEDNLDLKKVINTV